MPGFADALTAARAELAGTCSIPRIRTELDPVDLPGFDTALIDAAHPPAAVALALNAIGVRVSSDDIASHRAGTCPCIIQTGA